MKAKTALHCLASLAALAIAVLPASADTLPPAQPDPVAAVTPAPAEPIRNAGFVVPGSSGAGLLLKREHPIYRPGEGLGFYAEVSGLGWSRRAAAEWRFDLVVDVEVRRLDGQVLWGQKEFGRLAGEATAPPEATAVSGTLALKGIEPGVYVLGLRFRDVASGRIAETELPFAILTPPRRLEA